jgi:hypothetical protein
VLVASGAAELLSTGAELAVVAVRKTARGVELVLRPVGAAVSTATELSATVTVEVSAAAWEAAVQAARAIEASATFAGGVVVAVPLMASVAAGAAGAAVVGTALVVGEVVIGIVAGDALGGMLGREVHRCAVHGP